MDKPDILNEIVSDHWQIRDLLTLLRGKKPGPRKDLALKKLAPWLKIHSEAEDKVVNAFAKARKPLRVLGYEDEEEHATINELHRKLSHTRNPHLLEARLHLLCELIEHHLDEEEEEFFPLLKRELTAEESERMARKYRQLSAELDPYRPKPKSGLLGWLSARPDSIVPKDIAI